MKIISKIEAGAILAGLRLLQANGYPKEFESSGQLSKEDIDNLCEAINGKDFASVPVFEEKIKVWKLVSDTNEGTTSALYIDELEAEQAYIGMVCTYEAVREELGENTTPTFSDANEAWEEAVYSGTSGIIDTIDLDYEELTFIKKAPVNNDPVEYRNFYRCDCGQEWEDTWGCMCNDRCPECNKEIEPYASDEISIIGSASCK